MDVSNESDQERRVPRTRQGFLDRDMYGSSTDEDRWLGHRTGQTLVKEKHGTKLTSEVTTKGKADEQQVISEYKFKVFSRDRS